MKLKLKETISKILAWIHEPFLHNSVADTSTYYRARRDDTSTEVAFGVGSGGVNHGVWSDKLGKWLIYGTDSNVFVNQNIPMYIQSASYATNSYHNSSVYVWKFGAVVMFSLGGAFASLPNGGYTSLGVTLGSTFRPLTDVLYRNVSTAGNSGGAGIMLRVNTNGTVQVYNYSGSAYSGNGHFYFCYITNNF